MPLLLPAALARLCPQTLLTFVPCIQLPQRVRGLPVAKVKGHAVVRQRLQRIVGHTPACTTHSSGSAAHSTHTESSHARIPGTHPRAQRMRRAAAGATAVMPYRTSKGLAATRLHLPTICCCSREPLLY